MNPGNETSAASGALSKSEVESLLAQVAGPQSLPAAADASPAGASASDEPRPYDFRNPMLLPPKELRKLRSHQEEFANALAARLSQYLRLEVSIRLAGLQTIAYQKFAQSWANPSFLTMFKVEPLRGVSILEIPPRIGLGFVERLMGGPGLPPDPAPEISEIEKALLDQVVQLLLGEWCGQWSRLKELKPVVLGHETNGRFVQTSPPETIMLVVSLEARLGECTDKLQIGFPLVPLEPLIQQLGQSADIGADAASLAAAKTPLKWNPVFEDISVPVSAQWQGIELTTREVLALKVGDVVRIDPRNSQQVVVRLAEIPRFQGRPGTTAGQWAVELTRAIKD